MTICDENINSSIDDIVNLVYLRRYYEILNNKGVAYQLLSNLFKKRLNPFKKESDAEIPLSSDEISEATNEIKNKLPLFDYKTLLSKFSDVNFMKKAYSQAKYNYEKLQLFRIFQEEVPDSDVINKFMKESFHIENEYIMQINPCKYEIVPSYIIDECDKLAAIT
ncbi:MAG: hypothetical protein STSR0002_07400 [Smithella sp.]|jgi:hypothetical protein